MDSHVVVTAPNAFAFHSLQPCRINRNAPGALQRPRVPLDAALHRHLVRHDLVLPALCRRQRRRRGTPVPLGLGSHGLLPAGQRPHALGNGGRRRRAMWRRRRRQHIPVPATATAAADVVCGKGSGGGGGGMGGDVEFVATATAALPNGDLAVLLHSQHTARLHHLHPISALVAQSHGNDRRQHQHGRRAA